MDFYAPDLSLLDYNYGFSDLVSEPFSHRLLSSARLYQDEDDGDYRSLINYARMRRYDRDRSRRELDKKSQAEEGSPPKHRHDGKSPLPLGMDWSAPPRKWDGKQTVWPHDPRTGWSYCVTIPSWVRLAKSRGSESLVLYRVQVGIQSPDGITAIRVIQRRFSDFLELHSALKKEFPSKNLPETPPRKILRLKSKALLEERRSSLDDWMGKLLADIEVSRTVQVATFLELEAAVRSYFSDVYPQILDGNPFPGNKTPSFEVYSNSDTSFLDCTTVTTDHPGDIHYDVSEVGSPRQEKNNVANGSTSEHRDEDLLAGIQYQRLDGCVGTFPLGNAGSESGLLQAKETSVLEASNLSGDYSFDDFDHSGASRTIDGIQFQSNLVVAFHEDERQRMNRVINNMQQRLATTKTDLEDIITRLNQETAVRQFLTTKIKDLEVELETTRYSCKDNMEQACLSKNEKFTQMQWDMEELRKQSMEMEVALKSLQDENAHLESTKASILEENEMLLTELDLLKEKLESLRRHHEEMEVKSKADVKVLAKEVKSLRTSQSELKREFSNLMREKIEIERMLQNEKQMRERATSANEKLLHECNILRSRLHECSINCFIEEDDNLILDTSSPSDSLDLLATLDNRIGLLLAEAQLLAQEVDKLSPASAEENHKRVLRTDDDLRRMLTEILVDNARLRKLVNSTLRCALGEHFKSDKEDEEEEDKEKRADDIPPRQTVLNKFLER